MKVLVTGGAGFIGSNFIPYFLEKYPSYEVICLDNLTYAGNTFSLSSVMNNSRFTFLKGDIADEKLVDEIFSTNKIDLVINFAAESHVDRSIADPLIFFRTNILGVGVLLNACKKYGNVRFHQISTDEVYGDLPIDRKDLFFTESSPLLPSSPYSSSKAAADLLTLSYFRTFNLPVTISRCGNNYGPLQFPEKLIPNAITKAMKDENIPIFGSGAHIRDWIYVLDHCKAIDEIVHHGKIGEIYNVGANQEYNNLEVVKGILDGLKKPHTLFFHTTDRKGHDMRYALDASKIKNELGWSPEISFINGLTKTIEWYKSNTDWINEIEKKR